MPDLLITTGLILLLSGDIIVIGRAFQTTGSWGLACLIMPPAAIPFMVIHPRKSFKPAILMVAGISMMLLAGLVDESGMAGVS